MILTADRSIDHCRNHCWCARDTRSHSWIEMMEEFKKKRRRKKINVQGKSICNSMELFDM